MLTDFRGTAASTNGFMGNSTRSRYVNEHEISGIAAFFMVHMKIKNFVFHMKHGAAQ